MKTTGIVGIFLTALFLAACGAGNTTLRSEILASEYKGHPEHVLVLAIGFNQVQKSLVERNLADHLTATGVKVSKGQQMFGDMLDIDREYILRRLRITDIDAVLVLRLDRVKLEAKEQYQPQRELGKKTSLLLISEADVTGANQRIILPTENVDVMLRINLVDMATEQRVWTAESESFNAGSAEDIIKVVGVKVIQELKLAGLL